MVEGEEALDAEMAAAEDLFIEVGAIFLKVVKTVRHGSSGVGFCHGFTTPTRSGQAPSTEGVELINEPKNEGATQKTIKIKELREKQLIRP
jgi:hypothetical protein